ncbi:hypothetical protein SAMN05421819_1940 [Bryocella elongata]|uniref:Flavoprotein, HI0933 family n=1 Tax=Bryocella elongata TaxID=863522 RepID=A0A1H5XRR6_9BACT|nr:NAD(P)/FAD-dependent oxidoreductase [Bryocella elongata]SEG14352.1 hypothetical protein SAMN05421819_1940 [Bryocella elongata]
MQTRTDVVVIGGGAAGLMAALEAGRRGRRVLVLEHGEQIGRKILISGGGRCNFTNTGARAENYLSANPHFAKSAMARYLPQDFIALVQKHGIAFHEKTLGQLFCDGSARQIVTMLEAECGEAGVQIQCGATVTEVRSTPAGDAGQVDARFHLTTSVGDFACESLIIASGGLSIPKMGATGFGYDVARQFGHSIIAPRPALVPLVLSADDRERWCDLSGLSAESVAQVERKAAKKDRNERIPAFREQLLITHRGLSGPVVLQASSYWREGEAVRFDLAPGQDVFAPLYAKESRRDLAALFFALREVLPARFAERWVRNMDPQDWTNAGLARLEAALHAWAFVPAGTEGFAKAEVTLGGVDTRELDARTMESRRAEGLYFIGEVVDVTGWLGGYNFQWAWASGVSAGQSA